MGSDEVPRLLSLLSHELRSPLGVIRGYLRLLDQRGGELNDSQRRVVAAALKASDRASSLLDQASKLAQLRRGERALEPTRVRAGELTRGLAGLVTLPEDPHVTLDVADGDDMAVHVDAALMREALAALVSATARAQASDMTIDVSTRAAENQGQRGAGIDIRARVGGAATEHEVDIARGGLGLDLPLAAAAVDASRGRLRELSHDARHVGFTVWLPEASS
jgi:signal transduction histidine kinase